MKEVKFAINVYDSEMAVPTGFNFLAEALKNVMYIKGTSHDSIFQIWLFSTLGNIFAV